MPAAPPQVQIVRKSLSLHQSDESSKMEFKQSQDSGILALLNIIQSPCGTLTFFIQLSGMYRPWKYFIFFLLFAPFEGCKESEQKSRRIEIIDPAVISMKILETKDPIGVVDSWKISDGYHYILNLNKVLVFQSDGRFIDDVSLPEYLISERIEDFAVYKSEVFLLIKNKGLVISRFLNRQTSWDSLYLPFNPNKLVISDGLIFFYQLPNQSYKDKKWQYKLHITDLNGQLRASFFPYKFRRYDNLGIVSQVFDLTSQGVFFTEFLNDTARLFHTTESLDNAAKKWWFSDEFRSQIEREEALNPMVDSPAVFFPIIFSSNDAYESVVILENGQLLNAARRKDNEEGIFITDITIDSIKLSPYVRLSNEKIFLYVSDEMVIAKNPDYQVGSHELFDKLYNYEASSAIIQLDPDIFSGQF